MKLICRLKFFDSLKSIINDINYLDNNNNNNNNNSLFETSFTLNTMDNHEQNRAK